MTLNDLAIKYGSDKSSEWHNYCPFYEQTLPKNPKRLLEIGCLHGASARMWREWFPETEIHILDLFEENPIPDIPGVIFHKGDQTNSYILHNLRKLSFDVVISDGSHNCRDEWITFFGLIDSCGLYVLEDAHCADSEDFRQGLSFDNTMLGMTKKGNFPFHHTIFENKLIFIHATPSS